MLETRPLQSHDLHWLTLTTPTGWSNAAGLRRAADPMLSISFFEDGFYRGSAGVYGVWAGVYEAWLTILTMPADLRGLLRALRTGLAQVWELTKAHRIQAYCLAEFTKGIKLARRLGFEIEGVLRKGSSDRRDIILLAQVATWA